MLSFNVYKYLSYSLNLYKSQSINLFMDEKAYTELLDKAYAELPEVLYKSERFEIPDVKGRLIKSRTMISNFGDIAKHFSRDPNHMYKFFLGDVGVRGDLNSRGEVTLFSRFQPAMLNKSVKKYFQKFVECPNCHRPDTVLEQGATIIRCNACGYQETIQKL